ncbi:MAG: PAS domain S-box protein [Alphaproteobacteria bacterium]|nr:PAS domain S-box protein [Alphaproteobacteria bacterium]
MTIKDFARVAGDWNRHLVDLVSDLVCVCRDGILVSVNVAGARMLGHDDESTLVGRPIGAIIHPDFAEIVEMGIDVLAEESGSVPLILIRRDGESVEVEITARAFDDSGHSTVLIHARDITERTRAVEHLLKSEERYRRLVELALDFTCTCAGDEITFINRAGARLLGAGSATELVGRRIVELVHPDYAVVFADGLGALAAEKGPLPLKLVRLDGGVLDVECVVLPLGAAGEHAFMIEARDVTELKRAQEGLREREQRLQGIMDTVAEGIITADEHGLIQSANPAVERTFGWSARELRGRNLKVLMPEPYASGHDGYLERYLGGGHARVMGLGREVEGLRKDGSVFPLEINVAELKRGRTRLFIGILRDITERKRAEEALRRARDELEVRVEERTRELRQLSQQTRQILDSASEEGIVGFDRTGLVTFANPAAAAMLAEGVEAMVGRPYADILSEARLTESGEAVPIGSMLDLGYRLRDLQITLRRPDGEAALELNGAPIEEDGVVVGAVAVMRDVTDRKLAESKLRLAATVFETTAETIMVLDAHHRITAVNPAFTEIGGWPAEEALGTVPAFLSREAKEGEDDRSLIWDSVARTGRWQGELWNVRRNGEPYAERIAISAIPDEHGDAREYVVVASDITQRKLDEERIRYQANYDSLTGLPNRTLFMDRLNQGVSTAVRGETMLGLMFIDLDGFKMVNDTLGHDIGDLLLIEAGRRLGESVRANDTVARLGGDEFTVIMPNLLDFRNASVIAQRIIERLEEPFVLGRHETFVSASIGITTLPHDATDAQSLLKNADSAMYRAKEQGKANFQFFTADMNSQVSERMVLKNGLSKALERGELSVCYQPKLDLASGRFTGCEALLRWTSAELGQVSPVKFIPVLEETGLIGPVGEWVLETACRQYREWRDMGLAEMRVAVNLSVRQLRQPGIAQAVAAVLDRAGIEASGIEIEITESMIMKDTENAVAVLRELNGMGIQLAMDDFGTGYSSLSYLKRFPLHTIKIDRSFVAEIASDSDDLEIIRTIITMGHSLRRRIVAEGVETEAQKDILTRLGCDEIQGFLVSHPLPAADFTRLLIARRAST